MLELRIEDELKQAMLAGDAELVTTLRTLKSVMLNKKVADGTRDQGLSDEEVIGLFTKEAKKRQESADLYVQGGRQELADKELAEKAIIEKYLPAQLGEDEVKQLVEDAVTSTGASSLQDMGKVMGQVKAKAGAGADGGLIARLVKERLGL